MPDKYETLAQLPIDDARKLCTERAYKRPCDHWQRVLKRKYPQGDWTHVSSDEALSIDRILEQDDDTVIPALLRREFGDAVDYVIARGDATLVDVLADAVRTGNLAAVRYLLWRSDVDEHMLHQLFLVAVDEADTAMADLLYIAGANINGRQDSALVRASAAGDLSLVEYLTSLPEIRRNGLNPESLVDAVDNGHAAIVSYLARRDDMPNEGKRDALLHAVDDASLPLVKVLTSIPGIGLGTGENDVAFALASANGSTPIVRYLSRVPGVDPAQNNNEALVLAAEKGRMGVVRFLLSLPAVAAAPLEHAAQEAQENGHFSIAGIIRDVLADQ